MTDLGRVVNGDTIRFERMLPAPVQQVWELVTGPGAWPRGSRPATWS